MNPEEAHLRGLHAIHKTPGACLICRLEIQQQTLKDQIAVLEAKVKEFSETIVYQTEQLELYRGKA
jgi:hypothetical protein